MHLKKNYLHIKNSAVRHGFFTRLGGLSKKQFKSLNCSISNGDNKEIVFKNRLIAMKNLQLDKKKLILINQTHSSKVIKSKSNALAMVSDTFSEIVIPTVAAAWKVNPV